MLMLRIVALGVLAVASASAANPMIGKWSIPPPPPTPTWTSGRACVTLTENGATTHVAQKEEHDPKNKCSPSYLRSAYTRTHDVAYSNVTKAGGTTTWLYASTQKTFKFTTLDPVTATCDGIKLNYKDLLEPRAKAKNGVLDQMCHSTMKGDSVTSLCREAYGGSGRRRSSAWTNCKKTYPTGEELKTHGVDASKVSAAAKAAREKACLHFGLMKKTKSCGVMVPVSGAGATAAWGTAFVALAVAIPAVLSA